MEITKNTKVTLEGRGPLTLRPTDHVATGGEGAVYRSGTLVIKLYSDEGRIAREGLDEKLKLLQGLAHPTILAPKGLVLDAEKKPIGIYMPFADGEPLARVFTTDFRLRTSFDDQAASTLVERMRETTRFAHHHGAVMVDPNEMNWIADVTTIRDPKPIIIDVDSWTIGRWTSSAVMPSIRDWHTSGFTPHSDWFAWGVVTFQIYSGIHPYKGTLAGYKPGELERRMRENASVFSPGIALNRAVRDFTHIPPALRAWYKAVFQKGLRCEPPSPLDKGAAAVAPQALTYRTTTTATGSLIYEKLFESVGDPVTRAWGCGVVLTRGGSLIDLAIKRTIATGVSSTCEVVRVEHGWLCADKAQVQLTCTYIDDRTLLSRYLAVPLNGDRWVRYGERLFITTELELVELGLLDTARPLLVLKNRTQILRPKATRWFDGVGVEVVLGATFLVLPFGDRSCTTVRVPELDQCVALIAKAGHRFVTIVTVDAHGTYSKHELSFTEDYRTYRAWQGHTDTPELNIAILERGVCATIVQDGTLNVFVPSSGVVKSINDAHIRTDMQLTTMQEKEIYLYSGRVWSLRMQ